MKTNQNLIECERKRTTFQRIKDSYAENSMLIKFYNWLKERTKQK